MSRGITGAKRTFPNATLRLLQRELVGPHSGAQVHTARAFSECILPNQKVLEVESPDAHVGRFTPDGSCLVCFSLQLQSVLLYDYLGPVPAQSQSTDEPVGFSSFFKERWRLNLCSGSELLSRDFCLSLRSGAFLLLASSIPPQRQTAATAATGTATATRQDAAGIAQQQQHGHLLLPDDGAGDDQYASGQQQHGPGSRRAASSDWCEMTTFYVVDVKRCMKVDERRFPSDYFELNGNSCVSLYDNTLAITSTYNQAIHLLQINADGSLTDMQSIGANCQPDDMLPIQLAAAAEQQWWLQRQQQRHRQQEQMRILAAQQQAKLLNLSQLQQQQQQQLQETHGQGHARVSTQLQQQPQQLPVSHPNSLWAQAAAAAIRTIAASGSAAPTTAAPTAAPAAAQNAARTGRSSRGNARSGSEAEGSDDEMERRERRRRTPATRQQRQQAPQLGHPPEQGANTAVAGSAPGRPGAGSISGTYIGAAAAAATAAAEAASSAAVLDPGGQLIQGLQQRLLAFLAKGIVNKRSCDVAPSMWDFQYNFDVLSGLVIFRARFLDRQHLLLKLGVPTSGPASAVELSSSSVHFFAIYDLASTCFKGFWRGLDASLLAAVTAQPALLLSGGNDMSPWERCAAASLYPPGFAVGITQQQQQHADQSQQQRRRQQPRGSSRHGMAGDGTVVGGLAETMQGTTTGQLQQQQQRHTQDPGTSSVPVQQGTSGPINTPAGSSVAVAAATGAAALAGGGTTAEAEGRCGTAGVSNSSSSSKAAKERVKLLQQLVMLVLPGLQNLSTSPYLDPRLFTYSKHISPIIGLRNSPTEPLQFTLTKRYQPLLLHSIGVEGTVAGIASPATAASCHCPCKAMHMHQLQAAQPQAVVLQLEPAQPVSVLWGNEEVARRQVHLFHPTDPFVLTVTQTIAQPAVISIYYRA